MELYVIPVGEDETDKFIIYRPLLGLAFVGNRAMAGLAQHIARQGEAEDGVANGRSLTALSFLRQIGFLEADPPAPGAPDSTFAPTMAVLLMTNQCQLRCTYCYAAAGEWPQAELTSEQGFAAIDAVCENARRLGHRQFEISFHGGGEPTLAWSVLQQCVVYARQKPIPARITLTSNGVWSARQRQWIFQHLDGLTLSWDGTPQTQDRQRPFASGRGSADMVRHLITELDRAHFPYGIRLTATAPWPAFVDGVRFICEQTNCQSLQVEPAFNTARGGHGRPEATDCQAFVDAFMVALDVAQQHGRRLMYSGARLGLVTSSFCTAPYNALIIGPGGALVSCYEVTAVTHPLAPLSAIGRYARDEIHIHEPARQQLHSLMAARRHTCQDCFCYWSCAGDCYTRAFQSGPNGHLKRGARCDMNQAITRRMLLNGIAGGGGVWRRPAAIAHQNGEHA